MANENNGTGPENSGEPVKIDEAAYKELEAKLGKQGNELGEYRSFIEGITPLLEKLDKNPDLVQSIINDKITPELSQAIKEGKITIGEAKIIEQAGKDVKKELGKEGLEKTSAEDINKLVEEKVSKVKEEMDNRIKEAEELSDFKKELEDFIKNTSDFEELAPEISKWLEKHPKVEDIQVAYYAVKGQLSETKASEVAEKAKAEAAKEVAMNSQGGSGSPTMISSTDKIVDQLITGSSNPNKLF